MPYNPETMQIALQLSAAISDHIEGKHITARSDNEFVRELIDGLNRCLDSHHTQCAIHREKATDGQKSGTDGDAPL